MMPEHLIPRLVASLVLCMLYLLVSMGLPACDGDSDNRSHDTTTSPASKSTAPHAPSTRLTFSEANRRNVAAFDSWTTAIVRGQPTAAHSDEVAKTTLQLIQAANRENISRSEVDRQIDASLAASAIWIATNAKNKQAATRRHKIAVDELTQRLQARSSP